MSNDPTVNIISNEDLDLSQVRLKSPVIDKQWVKCRITNLYWTLEDNSKAEGGKAKQLNIELVTEEPATATDGKPVDIGQGFKTNILGTPVGKMTHEMVLRNIKFFQAAALGAETEKFGSPEQYIGRSIKAYFVAEPGKPKPGDDPANLPVYQRINRWGAAV